MSGHSKWATIKRKKEATDTKRSNMYAKLLRAVEVAAREGGGSVEGNMTLASAVEKAKSFSVPNDNIERAIKRGTGELGDGQRVRGDRLRGLRARRHRAADRGADRQPQPHRPGGPARLHRNGGSLGETGTVAWQFTRKGVIVVEKDGRARRGASAGARARGRRRGPERLRVELGHHRRARRTSRGPGRAGGGRRADLLGGAVDDPAEHDPGRRGPRRTRSCVSWRRSRSSTTSRTSTPTSTSPKRSWPRCSEAASVRRISGIRSSRAHPLGRFSRSRGCRVLHLHVHDELARADDRGITGTIHETAPGGTTLADGSALPEGCHGQGDAARDGRVRRRGTRLGARPRDGVAGMPVRGRGSR